MEVRAQDADNYHDFVWGKADCLELKLLLPTNPPWRVVPRKRATVSHVGAHPL